jgi:hypothetical protein
MASNIGLLMVREGLFDKNALESALRRKEREGGSLALNLVLAGAVQEDNLVAYYQRKLGLPRATAEQLEQVERATFELIPLEIIYDSGILPMHLVDEENLAVGLVDPTDRGLIAEATFFSGYSLVQHLLSVSEFAKQFERLARQEWKITPRELVRLERLFEPEPEVAEEVLEQADAMESRLEAALAADLDEVFEIEPYDGEEDAVVSGGRIVLSEAAASRVRTLSLPSLTPTETPVVLRGEQFAPIPSSGRVEVAPVTLQGVGPRDAADPRVSTALVAEAAVFDPYANTGDHVIVEGEAETEVGPVKVLGIRLDGGPKAKVDSGVLASVIGERSSGFGNRPKTAVPTIPGSTSTLDAEHQQYFRLLTRLRDTFGPPDPAASESIERIIVDLAGARSRDALGDSLLLHLKDLYHGVSVLTLNGPRCVVWRCTQDGERAAALEGASADIDEGGILHRIAQERVFYWGPLPKGSRLRAATKIDHGFPVFVAPVELRSKTILIVALDGGLRPFRSPGDGFETMLVETSRALERVILLRKRGRRLTGTTEPVDAASSISTQEMRSLGIQT